jgi:hypothetical protein
MHKKPKKRKSQVLSAHIEEQLQGEANHFLKFLEHYNIQGVLYCRMPDENDNIFVFSKHDSPMNNKALLTYCSNMSAIGAEVCIDKKKK